MQERYAVVGNEYIIKNFLKDIGANQLDITSSFLVQTAFRIKKFTEKEKELLKNKCKDFYLTKTLKVNKYNQFDYDININKLYELEVPIRACTYNINTSEEVALPQSSFVTYILPNPTNETLVAMKHAQSIFEEMIGCVSSPIDPTNNVFKQQLAHTNKDFRSERSTCIISKYVNFDIDFEVITGFKAWELYKEQYQENIKKLFPTATDILIIICYGGFHILLPKEYMTTNPYIICDEFKNIFNSPNILVKDIEFKGSKSYVPFPGTYQYGNDDDHIVQYVKI